MSMFPRDAACARADPELFFPPSDDYTAPAVRAQVADAKTVCLGCPVRVKCLTWALQTHQSEGIWGGTTPPERRAMTREHRVAVPA